MEPLPRISIITPAFQQAHYLQACIASLHEQGYPGLQHIVVDGGSTDGSKTILEANSHRLTWWCSEADEGQAHAINKGLAHADGEVFGWLNSDDLLLPGALQRIGAAFAADPDLLIYGGIRLVRGVDGVDREHPLDDAMDVDALFISPRINQQSTFFRMSAIKAIGGVDERLRYVMDHELWLQMLFRHGTSAMRLEPERLAVFRLHADSKTGMSQASFVDETAGVLHGLCLGVGALDLAAILSAGHHFRSDLRSIPVGADRKELVERMVIHFLLHWNRVVHSRERFIALRMFLASPYADHAGLSATQLDRLQVIVTQVDVSGWWVFRLKRKWNHLFGSPA